MKNNIELVKEWLKKADNDIKIAKLALQHDLEVTDVICFHAQQATEKILKAYLIYNHISFKKTHNLVYLLNLINEIETVSDNYYNIVENLQDFAVSVRYPMDIAEPTFEEAHLALEMVDEIQKYIENKIQTNK